MKSQPNQSIRHLNKIDLAGYCPAKPSHGQIKARIQYLIDHYLALDTLSDRLIDLPQQFVAPQPRAWQRIDWRTIHANQIVGVEPALFLGLIASSVEIETPIRAYAQISWSHFPDIHPPMAQFLGGDYDEQHQLTTPGVWEKEERQHAPAFKKIYQQLTGRLLRPHPNTITDLPTLKNSSKTLYRHAIRRITTEWSAVSVYLWLMAHSTGPLQHAIAQPLQDEVNHLAKFWGATRWGFADSNRDRLVHAIIAFSSLFGHHHSDRTASHSILKLSYLGYGAEVFYSFIRVFKQLCRWNKHLAMDALIQLLGPRPMLTTTLATP